MKKIFFIFTISFNLLAANQAIIIFSQAASIRYGLDNAYSPEFNFKDIIYSIPGIKEIHNLFGVKILGYKEINNFFKQTIEMKISFDELIEFEQLKEAYQALIVKNFNNTNQDYKLIDSISLEQNCLDKLLAKLK